MTTEQFTIVIPIPNKVLSPNCTVGSIGGRFMVASSRKRFRRVTREAIEAEQIESMPWEKVKVSPTLYYKTNRRHDVDNAIGSLKSIYDGIVDSGLVPDDTQQYMKREEPVLSVDKECSRVIIVLERME